MNRNLGAFLRQALAHADVERNAFPAPVVDHDLHTNVTLGHGTWIDAVFTAVTDHLFAIHRACGVLRADHALGDIIRAIKMTKRLEHFYLFITHSVGRQV